MEKIKLFDSVEQAKARLEPNKAYQIEALGKKFCLVLYQDKLYVTDDACPHRQASLSKGTVNHLGEIVCPLHGYQYSLKYGREASQRTDDALCYRIVDDEDGLCFYI